jgi:hypothetical protein
MNLIRKYISVIITVVAFVTTNAQVSIRASADRNKILIGEPINVTVDAYMPLGSSVQWFPSDTIPHFEIDNRSPVDTSQSIDGKKISQSFIITSFDSGRWQIPAFEVIVDGRPYYSDSIGVDVAFITFDPKEDYRDIKDIIEADNKAMKYVPWVIAAISLMLLAALVILLRKRKKAHSVVVAKEPLISAYDEAIGALSDIGKKGVSQLGEKNYYTSMNDILRKYVSRKFKLSTFERTNEELIMQLSKMNIPKDAFISLSQSLRMADFVKFAKYRPSEEDNRSNLETVRTSIEILDNTTARAL